MSSEFDLTLASVERRFKTTRLGADWQPYAGSEAKLVIAGDIGTTFSGASYAILIPGQKPFIENVKAFPGQNTASSKVPSVVLYDADGVAQLFGAEATSGAVAERFLEAGGQMSRWWKIHLKPDHLSLQIPDAKRFANSAELFESYQRLPDGLTAQDICADFLHYMVKCVGSYIRSRQSDGTQILAQLAASCDYVLTVPNGWELHQQQELRTACVQKGLVAADKADSAVSFVSEAEASINFCAHSSGASEWISEVGQDVVVCDAGGGTIDISSYKVMSLSPRIALEETHVSDCLIAGSTLVDRRARHVLQQRLKGSRWDNEEDIACFEGRFCSAIKETFTSDEDDQYLTIGSVGEHDESRRIRRGKLIFTGKEVASFFEGSISQTQESILARLSKTAAKTNTVVAMVGGFSESVYFRDQLQAALGRRAKICKPDEATSKAVANGAIAWYLDGLVSSRVAKVDYGIKCAIAFKPHKPAHAARQSRAYASPSGRQNIGGAFSCILEKGSKGDDNQEYIEQYVLHMNPKLPLEKEIELFICRRDEEESMPEFCDQKGLEHFCSFKVNLEPFREIIPYQQPRGKLLRAPFKLAMRLCGTELTAQSIYEHGNQVFRGPVSTVAVPRH